MVCFVSAVVRLLCMIWQLMRTKCCVLIGQTAGYVTDLRAEALCFISRLKCEATFYHNHTAQRGEQDYTYIILMLCRHLSCVRIFP